MEFIINYNSEEDTFNEESFLKFFNANPTFTFSIKVDDNDIVISDKPIDGAEEYYTPYSDLLRWNALGALCRYMKAHKG